MFNQLTRVGVDITLKNVARRILLTTRSCVRSSQTEGVWIADNSQPLNSESWPLEAVSLLVVTLVLFEDFQELALESTLQKYFAF